MYNMGVGLRENPREDPTGLGDWIGDIMITISEVPSLEVPGKMVVTLIYS